MMSKKDFELVAQVIYELHLNNNVMPHVSEGNKRRHVALAFASAFERYPHFDAERFVDAACHNI